MRRYLLQLGLSAAVAVAASGTGGGPPLALGACGAEQLAATYAFVPESNATGHVEYILTVINRSASRSCVFPAPLRLTLLGRGAKPLPTTLIVAPGRRYEVVLAPGQWAQASSQLSPDLFGPGEPASGPCEPTARALRVGIGPATIRAPMDPTPVCQHGTIDFGRLTAVPVTPRCSAGSLSASFRRVDPPAGGFAIYALTLRNRRRAACHGQSVVGFRLLGSGAHRLDTVIRAGVSSPYVLPAHTPETATATVSTRGAPCDPVATQIAVAATPAARTLTAVHPPLRVCRRGLIELSSLFRNG